MVQLCETIQWSVILWLQQQLPPGRELATDASLTGIGGTCEGQYFHFPIDMNALKLSNIAQVEMLAILMAVHIWSDRLAGKYILIHCDNQSIVHCINKGKANDNVLLAYLRNIAWECATHDYVIQTAYITSKQNMLPDLLS